MTVKTMRYQVLKDCVCSVHMYLCPAQTYDADVRDVYETAEAAADKWLSTKREEEEKRKEARVLVWERLGCTQLHYLFDISFYIQLSVHTMHLNTHTNLHTIWVTCRCTLMWFCTIWVTCRCTLMWFCCHISDYCFYVTEDVNSVTTG